MPRQETYLEDELIEIFGASPHQRNREMLIGYFGWRDGKRRTLAEIGLDYGVTRERARQICAKLVKRPNPASIRAPTMDRTLAYVEQRLPQTVSSLERGMIDAGLTRVGLGLDHVDAAARLLCRRVPFRTVAVGKGQIAVRPDQVRMPAAVVESAKKQLYYHGLTTVGQTIESLGAQFVAPVEPDLVVETVQLIEGFIWLDRAGGWFRSRLIARHGLPKIIKKILAVSPEVTIAELRAAIARSRRMWTDSPPEPVLCEFCRSEPGVCVRGDRIASTVGRDWRSVLNGVEAKLVEILEANGTVMERGALEEECLAGGMNRFSFHAFIACSPVIAHYGPSVYGLIGADVSPATVRRLIEQRRADSTRTRVLDGHGYTEDGKVWLRYRLSKAASTYAVVTVPAALKDVVRGRFHLLAPDGSHAGTLAIKKGRAWGLGRFLRRRGAQSNDTVRITLDLNRRTAVISLGGGSNPCRSGNTDPANVASDGSETRPSSDVATRTPRGTKRAMCRERVRSGIVSVEKTSQSPQN